MKSSFNMPSLHKLHQVSHPATCRPALFCRNDCVMNPSTDLQVANDLLEVSNCDILRHHDST